jgi:YcxB-like protein
MVTLNYTFTKDDYSNFFTHVMWFAPGKKIKTIKSWGSKFLFFVLLLSLVKISDANGAFDTYFFFTVFILACIFIIPLLQMSTVYNKQIAAFTGNPLNAHFFNDFQITLSEGGIFTKNKFAETRYQWVSIVKKEENKDYYFLFISTDQAVIIPKRALQSETQKEQLEKLFGEHISFNAEVGHLVKE